MNILANMKIGQRLALSFGFLVILFIGAQVFGAMQANKLNDNTVSFSENVVPSLTVLYKAKHELDTVRRLQLRALGLDSNTERVNTLKQADTAQLAAMKLIEEYEKLVADSEDAKRIGAVKTQASLFAEQSRKTAAVAAQLDGNPGLMAQYENMVIKEDFDAFMALDAAVEKLWTYNEDLSAKLSESSKKTNSEVILANSVTTVAVVISALLRHCS